MEQYFLNFELSSLAKKNGFDEPCIAYWEDNKLDPPPLFRLNYPVDISNLSEESKKVFLQRPGLFKDKNKNSELPAWAVAAPMYEQIKRWFFKTHLLWLSVWPAKLRANLPGFAFSVLGGKELTGSEPEYEVEYEDAYKFCIKKAFKMIKG